MKFLGQDEGEFDIDRVKIALDHPGGGSRRFTRTLKTHFKTMCARSAPNTAYPSCNLSNLMKQTV